MVFEKDLNQQLWKGNDNKKGIYTVFLRNVGQIKVNKLKGQKTVTVNYPLSAKWYTTKCFSRILQVSVSESMLHHDNVSSQAARFTVKFLEQEHIKATEYSPYSPDFYCVTFELFKFL